jgi:type IV secretory pathway protease TraF
MRRRRSSLFWSPSWAPGSEHERGAVVAFHPFIHSGNDDVEVVKRVLAVEGNSVEVSDDAVWVSGERVASGRRARIGKTP